MGKKKKADALEGKYIAPKKGNDKVVLNMTFEQAMKKALHTPLVKKKLPNKD